MAESEVLEKAYLQTIRDGNMPIIVITTGTKDYQSKFVARLHITYMGINNSSPTETCSQANTLDEIRKTIPLRCEKVERSPNDNPVIVESWL